MPPPDNDRICDHNAMLAFPQEKISHYTTGAPIVLGGNVWRDQSVMNEKLFLANFKQTLKDTFIQNCTSDVESGNKCRMYKKIKTVYKCETYMDCSIRHDLRMYYTKVRLSSHKFMVERARWRKDEILYHERTCSLCNVHDVQDEYHIAMICEYFKEVREKYVKQYYYNRNL